MPDITVTLPDNSQRAYPSGSTAADIAADISKSLGKKGLHLNVRAAMHRLLTQ